MARSTNILRIAIDTGGTFTDCVWLEDGQLRMVKVFSTPDDPSRAIAEAVKRTGHTGKIVLLHGTTVGTNTLLQRKGARVAFVTTAGFEDSIQIGRQARPKLYDFFFDAIEPLVPAELRFGVEERVDKDGNILVAPAPESLQALAGSLRRAKPQAIAVSLLFSFANPRNEQRIAAALAKLRLPLSISHQILPEFREYERASTVVINAYLQPVMQKYLQRLAQRFRHSKVFVMQSSGGLTSLETASREPVRTVLSGPAGGVVGATAMARRSGLRGIIGFDMGGTSTDVCLVEGEPVTTSESEIDGLPIRVPMLNIHTVGAGGGSMARFDSGGALRVGPESAGADPGPICYGKGKVPTVTDANLLLGRLRADAFLGGGFRLQKGRAERLCQSWLARNGSKWSLQRLAEGIVRVVNANMEKAIRVVSVEKGYDPRDFALVAFGGAGALHACDLAAAMEIPKVVVPYMPGALSAIGILMSDVAKDYSRTVMLNLTGGWPKRNLDRVFTELRSQATAAFSKEGWKGSLRLRESLDLRYKGQGFEVNVAAAGDPLGSFHAEHRRRFGYSDPQRAVELVTVRLRAELPSEVKLAGPPKSNVTQREARSPVVFSGRSTSAPILARDSIGAKPIPGPAVVCEYSATTVVPLDWNVRCDSAGNLILQRKK